MIGGLVMYGTLGLLVGPLAVSLLLALVRVAGREHAAEGAPHGGPAGPGAVVAVRRDERLATDGGGVRQDA